MAIKIKIFETLIIFTIVLYNCIDQKKKTTNFKLKNNISLYNTELTICIEYEKSR